MGGCNKCVTTPQIATKTTIFLERKEDMNNGVKRIDYLQVGASLWTIIEGEVMAHSTAGS